VPALEVAPATLTIDGGCVLHVITPRAVRVPARSCA
jgi:hypothetical protein